MRHTPSTEPEEFPIGLAISGRRIPSVPNDEGWAQVRTGAKRKGLSSDRARLRAFTLPDSVDVDKVKAEYKNGVLTVTLAKKEAAKPKTIRVEINNNW